MTNKAETQERRAYLAEHMSVECGAWNHEADSGFCDLCDSQSGGPLGRRYLLRRECRNRLYCLTFSNCEVCSGLGYVYDDSTNALTEAIRAKGWQLILKTWHTGDAVGITTGYEWGLAPIGVVLVDEGYRWPESAEVAAYRACRAEEGE